MHKLIVVVVSLTLGACATIIEGVDQTIQVEVVPAHGTCEVRRDGSKVGFSTPERRQVTLSKSKNNLEFTCSAPGYQTRTEILSSELSAATVGSFFLLDLGVVDAATGAWQKYPSRVTIVLQK